MFQGDEIPIEAGAFGLVGSKNLSAIPPTALLVARNVAFDQGVLSRAGGSAQYNATPLVGTPAIRGALDWWPDASTQRLLIVAYTGAGGTILRDTGAGTFGTTLKQNLSAVGLPVWAEGGAETIAAKRKAFLTTGADVVQVVDGDAVTSADIGINKPADWSGTTQPRFLLLHNNRLWGLLGHRAYWSTIADHEDFGGSGSGSIAVFPGKGQFLQGAVSWRSRLFLFKWPKGIYWIDDSPLDLTEWKANEHNMGAGLAGPNAIAVTDDDVFFLSEIGHIHQLSAIQAFGDIANSDITAANELGPWIREHLEQDAGALARAHAKYYPERKEVHFAVRGYGDSANTLRLVVDLNRRGATGALLPRIRVEDKDVCEALITRRDAKGIERLVSGDAAGTVWLLDQDDKSKGGAPYLSEFQLPHTDFGWYRPEYKTRRKILHWLEVVMQPTGNYDLSIDTILDGSYRQTVLFNLGLSGSALDSFVLDQDLLAGDRIVNTRHRIYGECRRLSLVGRLSGAGQDFSLSQCYVAVTPGGDKR